eukprot:GAHX01001462.1.p1 GENE.GAHX01001462.1~~GAHX01001462.1.p1  ORF type:complete len:479 (-),score=90.12 GAHX01001462.1:42-1478(-)
MPDWPLEYSEKLILSNPGSNTGILTLWSLKELVAQKLDPNSYAVIGNFYDVFNGLEPFMRNCLANPKLRYFIIVGSDLAGSKKTIKNFFELGIENGFVKDTQVPVCADINVDDANLFRESSKLFDLTSKIKNLDDPEEYKKEIEAVLKDLPELPPYMEPKTYPKTEFKPDVFPSTNCVFKIEDKHISQAWLKILNTIIHYGTYTQTTPAEATKVRECINLIAVIHEEDPDEPLLPSYMRFKKEELPEYFKSFCEGTKPKDTSYTYGNRFNGEPHCQFEKMKALLKKNKYSKRAFSSTWRLDDITSATPPCVISIQTNIQNEKLFLTCYIRSNDMFRAWPLNAFGLRKIQKTFCEDLKCEMGSLTIISQSAHVYKENFKEMDMVIEKNYKIINDFKDERGYYTISVSCGELEMKHFSNCGIKLRTFAGKTAREILFDLINKACPDDPHHISYISCELSKAEFAMKYGYSYTQDEELVKK